MGTDLILSSGRAQQARLAILLGSKLARVILALVFLVLLAIGIWLRTDNNLVGWFLIGLSAWPFMLLIWNQWHLKDLPPAKKVVRIDDVLDADVLGRLTQPLSPKKLAEAAAKTSAGMFFAVRLGIGPTFLSELSSDDQNSMAAVWQSALRIQQQLGAKTISGAAVVAALADLLPNRDQLLAQLQLTFDDILAGAAWYHHLQFLAQQSKDHKLGGGIGRDLSFGYTPLLEQFALNISQQVSGGSLARQIEGHEQIVDQLVQQLSQGGRQNAILIGQSGVGKTTLVYSFAERLLRDDSHVPSNIRYNQVMLLDPASLIARAKQRGDLEELLNRLLLEAHSAKNVILFLDNAEMFFSDGTGAVDLRNILLPVLEGGALRIIMSMDEQQWLKLSQATPSLAQQLNRIPVAPLNESNTRLVCEDQLLFYEFDKKVVYMYQSIKAAYRLGARYVTDQAMPGQALNILQSAAQYAKKGLVTNASVETAVEKTFGIKVATANNEGQERDKLMHLEDLLHQRMINQTHAVSVVANALRRARSGVRNQNRPIGAFMFLGPTGVGKTELAKALAAVYFGGENRLARVDLNEFGQASDVSRLIADAATDAHSLTAQISKLPFSVVLLDEIEKAHPNVLNTLLQMLDEGILRDANNREVSFRDAIIIATSNAGADRIRQYIDSGYKLEQFEEKFTNELIDSGVFKPEFLNRFDEITVFRPLTEDELMQVVDLMLAGVNKTLEQQNIKVSVADDAKRKLVQMGNDPRLGARPLRRTVQRTVENFVAKQLLVGTAKPGQTIQVTLADISDTSDSDKPEA